MTLKELSHKTGYSESQLSRWENGQRAPDVEQLETISQVLSVQPHALMPVTQISVVGRVGAGNEIFSIDDHALGDGLYKIDCPKELDAETTVAVEVSGDSMLPILNGWLVYYSRRENFGATDIVGRTCVVKTLDGRYYLKMVRPGYKPDTYNLLSTNATPMENVEVEWAAPMLMATPHPDKVLAGEG